MIKTYQLMGFDRNGYCRQCYMESVNKPNTNKWLQEVAEMELGRDFKYTSYCYVCGDDGFKKIRDKRPAI